MDRQQPDADEDEGEAVDRHQPDLEADERLHAGTGPTPPAARIIHELIREDGEAELERSIEALLWSAFGAGLSMGFSFFTMSIIKSGLPEAPWAKLVTATGYTLGFIIVVLGRQQLFTESTLTAVLPLLTRKDAKTALQTARLWGIVLVFNILGTFAFAWLISHDALFDTAVNQALRSLALMVWLMPGAGQARLWLIFFLTYVVAAAQFSHIIAGSVEAAFDVFVGHLGLGGYITRFLLPTLIGNTIGGVSLVAILNHVPVRSELPGAERA